MIMLNENIYVDILVKYGFKKIEQTDLCGTSIYYDAESCYFNKLGDKWLFHTRNFFEINSKKYIPLSHAENILFDLVKDNIVKKIQ